MTQRFKQKSNVPVAIGFSGIIVISQLMIFNMGYQMPWYFLAVLGILCAVIVWGFIANDIILSEDQLVIRSGPFKNTIPLNSITKLSTKKPGLIKNAKANHQLNIHYDKGKKYVVHPNDRQAFVLALSKQNPQIEIAEALKQ